MTELYLVNKFTGEPATPKIIAACKMRAIQILESPYSSPEQIEWAMRFVDDPVQYMLRPMQEKRMTMRTSQSTSDIGKAAMAQQPDSPAP